MNSHFWMRKYELVGNRKPPRDSRVVIEAAAKAQSDRQRREAEKSAARRLWNAMEAWA